jgi:hypothetical protein
LRINFEDKRVKPRNKFCRKEEEEKGMDFRKCSQIEYELGLIKEKVIIGMRNVG